MEHLLKQIKDNYLVLALIVALIIWYAGVNARLTQAEADVKDLKTTSEQIVDIKIQLQRIDTSVQFIREEVSK